MNYQRFILLAVVALSTLCRGETTNTFGIHLTTGPVDPRLLSHGKGDWSAVRFAESPVISAADIISYDFAEHAMRLRPEALKRIPPPPVHGVPFVVVANGERV